MYVEGGGGEREQGCTLSSAEEKALRRKTRWPKLYTFNSKTRSPNIYSSPVLLQLVLVRGEVPQLFRTCCYHILGHKFNSLIHSLIYSANI